MAAARVSWGALWMRGGEEEEESAMMGWEVLGGFEGGCEVCSCLEFRPVVVLRLLMRKWWLWGTWVAVTRSVSVGRA